MEKDLQKIGEKVVSVLCEIYDPEIPVNIYELGLIYDVQVSDNNDVKVLMTFTAPNCPVAESLPVEINGSEIGVLLTPESSCLAFSAASVKR